MKIRKYFLPRTLPDIAATIFLSVCIPITFWFQIFIVLPEFHSIDSILYKLIYIGGIFLVFNIQANMLAIMLQDTSVKGELLIPPDDPEQRKLWHMCPICEILSPPRSWHCTICNGCILKRDHHCVFTGCCIGHLNHRYFIILVIYLFIGTTYSTIYNTIFIWSKHSNEFFNYKTLLKMIFPMFMLIIDINQNNYYLTIYELNLIGSVFTLILIIYHGRLILNGAVVYERNNSKSSFMYNLGWKNNIRMVLGKRWYLTWLSPFVNSPLPHDGIHWETVLSDSSKSR